MTNYFGLPDAGSDNFNVNDWTKALDAWKAANAGKMPIGQEFGLPQDGSYDYYGAGNLNSLLQKYQGAGSYGTDSATGIPYYAPTSGRVNALPDYNPAPDFQEKLGLGLIGGIATGGLLAGGLGASAGLGAAEGAGFAGLGTDTALATGLEAAGGAGLGGLPESYWGMQASNGLNTPFTGAGGDMSFLDDLFGEDAFDFLGTDETAGDGFGGIGTDEAGGMGGGYDIPGGVEGSGGLGTDGLSQLKRLLLGSNSDGKGWLDILGGNNGLLGTGLQVAPSLAAINYAKNQDPFDTSRLTNLYGQFDPQAQAFQYDTNTGLGRQTLTSNLARRGVSGSSFGDQSLTNYNTFRDLGRGSLINQGIGTQAGIAGQILNADIAGRQSKNDLYGRALLALSGGLSPRMTGGLLA